MLGRASSGRRRARAPRGRGGAGQLSPASMPHSQYPDTLFPSWMLAAVGAVTLLRVANAVLMATYFVPDEFWQHGEVAHLAAFGFGHRTWEWNTEHCLRSVAPLLPSIGALKALHMLGLDYTSVTWLVPRVIHGIVAAVADVAAYTAFTRWFPPRLALASSLVFSAGWFAVYCLPRSLANSTETAAVAVAIAAWAWTPPHRSPMSSCTFAAAATFAVLTRPPIAAFLLAFVVFEGLRVGRQRGVRAAAALWTPSVASIAAGAICAALIVGADSHFHGSWPELTALNFARFNAAAQGGSGLFGSHPGHWYLTAGLPAVLAFALPATVDGAVGAVTGTAASAQIRRAAVAHSWGAALAAGAVYCAALSWIPHKEFRFLMPLLPWVAPLAAAPLAQATRRGWAPRTVAATLRGKVWLLAALLNCGLALYTCAVHQRGPIALLAHLRAEAQAGHVTGVDFLMPCHAAPAYGELHVAAPLRFVPCDVSDLAAGTSPSKAFEADPAAFAHSLYRKGEGRVREPEGLPAPTGLPSHVACFDTHCAALAPVLGSLGFREDTRIFHTHMTGDSDAEQSASYVHVWRLTADGDSGAGGAESR